MCELGPHGGGLCGPRSLPWLHKASFTKGDSSPWRLPLQRYSLPFPSLCSLQRVVAPSACFSLGKTLLYLDKKIGKFLEFLEAGGWLDNAIVVVSSDNGACPQDGGTNYPLRGSKETMFEGGFKVRDGRGID